MTTVAKLVRNALMRIRVIDAVQPVKPEDMSDAIEALNAMMARWEADGIALGWSPVSNPSDDVPIPDEAIEPVWYNLALRMRANYGGDIEADVAALAEDGLRRLQADVTSRDAARLNYDLPIAESARPYGSFYGDYE